MLIELIEVASIVVGARLRAVDGEKVEALVASISSIGLRTPITVRIVPEHPDNHGVVALDVPVLVAGRHRLEAAKKLGWTTIQATVSASDELDARLWEIAENLHRADLTVLERSEHIAEWVRLVDQKAQLAPIESKRSDGRGHRREGGVNSISRDLGVDRTEAQRSVKIDRLTPEAKQAARDMGRADNQAALLQASKAAPEKQAEAIRTYEPVRRAVSPAPAPMNDLETEEQWMAGIMRFWNRAHQEWREEFMRRVDVPVFDRTKFATGG